MPGSWGKLRLCCVLLRLAMVLPWSNGQADCNHEAADEEHWHDVGAHPSEKSTQNTEMFCLGDQGRSQAAAQSTLGRHHAIYFATTAVMKA